MTPRSRRPYTPLLTALAVSTVPAGAAAWLHPAAAGGLVVAEVLMVLTVVTSALFGSRTVSERAFRLLRWVAGRAEPPTPARGRQARLTSGRK